MLLELDIAMNTLTNHRGDLLGFGRSYDLLDAAGHSFVVGEVGDYYTVTITQGDQVVQEAKVHALSATIGQQRSGDSRLQSYKLNLDPAKPVWPIRSVVDQLIARGLEGGQISPMFTDSLLTCVPSDLYMVSDGDIWREAVPGGNDRGDCIEFRVTDASWAVLCSEGTVLHAYLGMDADGEGLLDIIEMIKAGTVTVLYTS